MATKFIKYEKALLKIAGTSIFAESAELSFNANIAPVTSVKGELQRYAPLGPAVGTLTFSHYCTGDFHDFLNPLTNVERTGEPFMNGTLADLSFDRGYVKSLSFSVEPYRPILFKSTVDIYGPLGALTDAGASDAGFESYVSEEESVPIAHGLKTYMAGTNIGISQQMSLDYSINTARNPVMKVGDEYPARVTKEDVIINMTVRGEDFGTAVTMSGISANATVFIYDVYGSSPLVEFGCTGTVYENNISVGAGGYMNGSLSLSQEYLTGRAEQ